MSEYRAFFQAQRHMRGSITALALYPDPAPRCPATGPIGTVTSLCAENALKASLSPLKASSISAMHRLLALSMAKKNWHEQTNTMAMMFPTMPTHSARAPAAISPDGHIVTHLNGVSATTTRQGSRRGPPAKYPYSPTVQIKTAITGSTM